jgi:hypothetical protein
LADLRSSQTRRDEVEHDQVVAARDRPLQAGNAVAGDLRGAVEVAQVARQQVREVGAIFDQQDLPLRHRILNPAFARRPGGPGRLHDPPGRNGLKLVHEKITSR